MIAVISLFAVVLASLLVTRVATVMLTLTGLSRQSARFQARSAFTGAGFTTAESESVVNHPVRRRIVMSLMLLGNAGIVTGLASLLLSFTTAESGGDALTRVGIIVGFLFVLNRLAASQPADRALSRVIERALRRFTDLDVRDYAGLLRLTDDWVIGEIVVEKGDWFDHRTIGELKLRDEGVVVLGVERAGNRYVGAPGPSTLVHAGDRLVLYGLRDTISRIDVRERTADGELDWIASQIDFTERYLAQQALDREIEETEERRARLHDELQLRAGERPERDEDEEPGDGSGDEAAETGS